MKDCPPAIPFGRRVLLHTIYLDSMIYPLSSIGALLFYIMAALYILFNASPVLPDNMPTFLAIWVPLLILKFLTTSKAYPYVAIFTVWRSQQAWFAYSWTILKAALVAIRGYAFPSFQTGWFNTGAKRNRIQWQKFYPLLLVASMLLCMAYRILAILVPFMPKLWLVWTSGPAEHPLAWETVSSLVFGFAVVYLLKDWAWESLPRASSDASVEHSSHKGDTGSLQMLQSDCEFDDLLQQVEDNFRTGRVRYSSRFLQLTTVVLFAAVVCYLWSIACAGGPEGGECFSS
jgi:hypothetical protein